MNDKLKTRRICVHYKLPNDFASDGCMKKLIKSMNWECSEKISYAFKTKQESHKSHKIRSPSKFKEQITDMVLF